MLAEEFPAAGLTERCQDATVPLSISGVCTVDPTIVFEDRGFAFSGESRKCIRRELEGHVLHRGGRFLKSITKDIDFLVVCDEGNELWAFACYGRKVRAGLHDAPRGPPRPDRFRTRFLGRPYTYEQRVGLPPSAPTISDPREIPEHHLWTLTKDGRRAEARTRMVPIGLGRPELTFYVSSRETGEMTLLWSQVFEDARQSANSPRRRSASLKQRGGGKMGLQNCERSLR